MSTMNRMIDRRLLALVLLTVVVAATVKASQQDEKTDDSAETWKPLRSLLGRWEGTGSGAWGDSTVERTFELVFDGRFVLVRNRSIYEPQEKNPNGETHRDWGMFSFDQGREKLVLREFHDEGFVNTYVADKASTDGKTVVFTTEHIENNIAPGWRARETYTITGDDSFEEKFELAPPDGEFKVYVTNRFRRAK